LKIATLYLIPVPISEKNPFISDEVKQVLSSVSYFVVENLKMARRALRSMGYKKDFNTEVTFFEWDKHSENQSLKEIENWMVNGEIIGVLSDAGLPCIADPGNRVVALAHQLQADVRPLSGPSSIILALIASGFNGQNFSFNGYLPIDKAERIARLKQLESMASAGQTQIFMETPYRNESLWGDILANLNEKTLVSIAVDIFGEKQYIKSMSIKDWKASKDISFHKVPAVFCMYR
jgi:16S rRNA (cytidine1402-2'-O)-methyltransferase